MGRTISVIALIALASASAGTRARADTYSVSNGVKGVVDMYDLSSVSGTTAGFQIWNVAVSDHFPTIFGPVAYRVSREDYDCTTGRYDIAVLKEYDRDGKLLNHVESDDRGAMHVVAGTSSSEMYNRYCEASRRGLEVIGLAPKGLVERSTPQAAYRYGQALLDAEHP